MYDSWTDRAFWTILAYCVKIYRTPAFKNGQSTVSDIVNTRVVWVLVFPSADHMFICKGDSC